MDEMGILKLCKLTDEAEAGNMPVEKLVKVSSAYYTERTIGVTRLYAAKGADEEIDRLVRCIGIDVPDGALYAVLVDNSQYQIKAKQKIVGTDDTDLTLVRVEDNYDIADE